MNFNQAAYDRFNLTPGGVGSLFERPLVDVRQYWREWLDREGYPWWPFWSSARSWWEIRDLPNVLVVHFATLKRDLLGEIQRIAAFLDVLVDETRWNTILEHCSFDWMKTHAEKVAPNGVASWEGGARTFIHRGVNGRWTDILTAEDIAEYEERAIRELGPACARWLATGEVG